MRRKPARRGQAHAGLTVQGPPRNIGPRVHPGIGISRSEELLKSDLGSTRKEGQ